LEVCVGEIPGEEQRLLTQGSDSLDHSDSTAITISCSAKGTSKSYEMRQVQRF